MFSWCPSESNGSTCFGRTSSWRRWWSVPRYRVSKNQRDLTATEWARFIHAIEAIADPGASTSSYLDFVDLHDAAMTTMAGKMWDAHSMAGHDGRNFLSLHQDYLARLEARLRLINPLVTIPLLDWVEDRAISAALSNPADLEAPHGQVHNVVGGAMSTSRSPADPTFWLHHSFIDKLWADWQAAKPRPASNPPNTAEVLQAAPIMTRSVPSDPAHDDPRLGLYVTYRGLGARSSPDGNPDRWPAGH